MTAQAFPQGRRRGHMAARLLLPFAVVAVFAVAAAAFIAYVLWPRWPNAPIPLDTPAIPITVAGVLFNVPPAAIRAPVQRHAGAHERIDLAFLWPSLAPPPADGKGAEKPTSKTADDAVAAPPVATDRLFVTIAGLGSVLAPLERLRSIYPRYVEAQAGPGPDGLVIAPFRAGTPYQGEDLIYLGAQPEQFFARCTRQSRGVPGSCIQDRVVGAAAVTLRFPREWLQDWHRIASGFDRLIAQLQPQGGKADDVR